MERQGFPPSPNPEMWAQRRAAAIRQQLRFSARERGILQGMKTGLCTSKQNMRGPTIATLRSLTHTHIFGLLSFCSAIGGESQLREAWPPIQLPSLIWRFESRKKVASNRVGLSLKENLCPNR